MAAVIALSILGILFGLGLAFASLKLIVEEDPQLKRLLEILPGLNCGACGKAGCSAFAGALLKHEAPVNGCLPGGQNVAKQIGACLGISSEQVQIKKAVVHCGTTFANRTRIAHYQGIDSCSAAMLLIGAGFACPYSCLGFGDCQAICPFHAIRLVQGRPEVDFDRCTGCGLCVKTCPRNIISLEGLKNMTDLVAVACRSYEKGAQVKKICEVGCIACKICERMCPGIFKVEQNLAKMNYEQIGPDTALSKAVQACPQKTIVKVLDKEQVKKYMQLKI